MEDGPLETIAIVAKDFIVNIGKGPEYGSNKVLSKNLQIAAATFFENPGEQKTSKPIKLISNYKDALLIWSKFCVYNHGQNI